MCTVPGPLRLYICVLGLIQSVLWLNPGVGWLSSTLWCWPCPVLSCPVLCSALSVWMEQCASTASLLASVREQERQFEMLSRALEEERRSCAGTLPRPLPNMQVTRNKPRPPPSFPLTCTHIFHWKNFLDSPSIRANSSSVISMVTPHPICVDWLDGSRN